MHQRMEARKLGDKYILVPDCDDDRWDHDSQRFVNPNHIKAQAAIYGTGKVWEGAGSARSLKPGDRVGGWYPPHTLALVKGVRTPVNTSERQGMNPKSLRAGCHAVWWKEADGTNRITIWGADDSFLERTKLSDQKARTLWNRIQDFITIKTLWNLGFG